VESLHQDRSTGLLPGKLYQTEHEQRPAVWQRDAQAAQMSVSYKKAACKGTSRSWSNLTAKTTQEECGDSVTFKLRGPTSQQEMYI
jgi:hypothetical protein